MRLFFGLTVALAAGLGGVGWVWCWPVILTIWSGTTIGYFESLGFGKFPGHTWYRDAFFEDIHGFAGAIVTAVYFVVLSHFLHGGFSPFPGLPVLIGGLFCPVCYWIGWSVEGRTGWEKAPLGLRSATEVAEALYGACFAVGTYLGFV